MSVGKAAGGSLLSSGLQVATLEARREFLPSMVRNQLEQCKWQAQIMGGMNSPEYAEQCSNVPQMCMQLAMQDPSVAQDPFCMPYTGMFSPMGVPPAPWGGNIAGFSGGAYPAPPWSSNAGGSGSMYGYGGGSMAQGMGYPYGAGGGTSTPYMSASPYGYGPMGGGAGYVPPGPYGYGGNNVLSSGPISTGGVKDMTESAVGAGILGGLSHLQGSLRG